MCSRCRPLSSIFWFRSCDNPARNNIILQYIIQYKGPKYTPAMSTVLVCNVILLGMHTRVKINYSLVKTKNSRPKINYLYFDQFIDAYHTNIWCAMLCRHRRKWWVHKSCDKSFCKQSKLYGCTLYIMMYYVTHYKNKENKALHQSIRFKTSLRIDHYNIHNIAITYRIKRVILFNDSIHLCQHFTKIEIIILILLLCFRRIILLQTLQYKIENMTCCILLYIIIKRFKSFNTHREKFSRLISPDQDLYIEYYYNNTKKWHNELLHIKVSVPTYMSTLS